ncbi:unnamed protein product [Caenorhabditis bovis]|uniref:UDP-glucuronosyltransferase n=1 Tax=Caenorhabditis bovis TaxID=2654633 RepID=A0A8S1FCU0_9PELO|nr:unnamed protein product [Caenorhabditis bovis]
MMTGRLVQFIISVAILIFQPAECSFKILVFSPAISKSHLISTGRIADELSRAGHDVTLLEVDFLGISDNVQSSKRTRKRVVRNFRNSANFSAVLNGFSQDVLSSPNIFDYMHGLYDYQMICNQLCQEFLERDEVFNELKRQNFDAFFSETIHICGFGYAHALAIKRIFMVSSCPFIAPVYDYLGHPMPISTVPFSAEMSTTPTYWERANNLFRSAVMAIQYRYTHHNLAMIYRNKFGSNFPAITDILRAVDIIFVSTDEIIDIPSLTFSNVVHIGGLGIDEIADDSNDAIMRSEMSKGKNGVVLFSLGTVANTTRLPEKVLRSFLHVTRKFPDYHFLIRADKYDKKTRQHAEGLKNVFISDWLPQPQILAHPNLTAFITHCGYNSVMESARSGVPLIAIPLRFDQPLNGRAIEKKGWGIRVDKRHLLDESGEAIRRALGEILTNPAYKREAMRLRDLIRTKPMNSRKRFIETTEWVLLNNGVKELYAESRSLDLITYYNLDVLFGFLMIPLVPIIVFMRTIRMLN